MPMLTVLRVGEVDVGVDVGVGVGVGDAAEELGSRVGGVGERRSVGGAGNVGLGKGRRGGSNTGTAAGYGRGKDCGRDPRTRWGRRLKLVRMDEIMVWRRGAGSDGPAGRMRSPRRKDLRMRLALSGASRWGLDVARRPSMWKSGGGAPRWAPELATAAPTCSCAEC